VRAADAEEKRKLAEAEQQRLKEEVQRQAKAAADAEAKRKAAEAEQQRLAAVRAEEDRKAKAEAEAAARSAAPSATTVTKAPFEIRNNVEAVWTKGAGGSAERANQESVTSIRECEASCARSPTCKIFTYNKNARLCYMYSSATFASNENFDSGIRNSAALPAAQPTTTVAHSAPAGSTGSFKIIIDKEASGTLISSVPASSMGACEQNCARSATCDIFSVAKSGGLCFLYSRAGFKGLARNVNYYSGIRASACLLTDQSSQLRLACSE
jgi:PAN domain